MQKREVTKKQLAVIILLSIGMLAAAALLNQFFPAGSKQTKETLKQTAVTPKVTALPSLSPTQKPTPTPDPTKKVATFFQGPKAYEGRREWSGKWGKEFYDGGSFGAFGCGLCCMANIYTTFSSYESSPVDMYRYAKKVSGYGGGGDVDFGTVCAQHRALGFGDLVGQREDRAVSALQGDESEPDTGVAGGRLDDHTAGLELSGALRGVDDALRDAVLGRSSGIEVFHFDGDGRLAAVGDVMQLDEWRVADEFGEIVVDGHRRSRFLLRFDWCFFGFVYRADGLIAVETGW